MLVGLLLGTILAFKSRSTGAKWAAGLGAIFLLIYLFHDAIDWDDWGEPLIILLAIPFALMNKDSEDD